MGAEGKELSVPKATTVYAQSFLRLSALTNTPYLAIYCVVNLPLVNYYY
jgi:hypothetical protein